VSISQVMGGFTKRYNITQKTVIAIKNITNNLTKRQMSLPKPFMQRIS
jgi:hypothetical protein